MVSGVTCTPGRSTIFSTRPCVDGGHPAARFVDRHERAQPADLTQHRSALDGIDPDGGAFDGRRGRLQPGQHHRDEADDEDAGHAKQAMRRSFFRLATEAGR